MERLTFLCSDEAAHVIKSLINLERVSPRMFLDVCRHLREQQIIPYHTTKKIIKMRKNKFNIDEVLISAGYEPSAFNREEYRCNFHAKLLSPLTRFHFRQIQGIDHNSPKCVQFLWKHLEKERFLTRKAYK